MPEKLFKAKEGDIITVFREGKAPEAPINETG